MKILFIGGTGTISGAITRQLAGMEGYELTILNRGHKTADVPSSVRQITGDINNEDAVKNIVLFNMVGRKMRTFTAEKGERYEVSDLPNGVYVVQLFGKNNKVLTTQRLTKK